MKSVLLDDGDSKNTIYKPGDIVLLVVKDGFHVPKDFCGRIVAVNKTWVLIDCSDKYASDLQTVMFDEILRITKLNL